MYIIRTIFVSTRKKKNPIAKRTYKKEEKYC